MASMASDTVRDNSVLPARYASYRQRWELLGYPAFVAMVVIFYLMVAKPSF
jgi:uncharacterized membrane protein